MTLLGKLSHFFQNLFTKKGVISDMSILDCIPKIINDADNEMLTTIPTMEELREVVFAMSSQSAVSPDGMSEKFYQSYWDIIKEGLLLMTLDFFFCR